MNEGSAIALTDRTPVARSSQLPRRAAEKHPSGMPTTTAQPIPSAVSATVDGSARHTRFATLCRDQMSEWGRWAMWGIAEIVAMATDLAEFLGAALGLYLLFGIPLFPAALITGVATFLVLGLQRYGARAIEAVVVAMLAVISGCYLVELLLERPDWGAAGSALAQPRFDGGESVVLAAGILGATVMPHVIFLHSALTQHRIQVDDSAARRKLFRFEIVDIIIAMSIAGAVNAAMLLMAAATFYDAGLSDIASIEVAHRTLEPLVGNAASTLFGISLLAAGLSSTTVGTMAGQVVPCLRTGPSGVASRTLPGLRSRWTIPASWASCIVLASSSISSAAWRGGSGAPARASTRLPRSMYSRAKNGRPSCSPTS